MKKSVLPNNRKTAARREARLSGYRLGLKARNLLARKIRGVGNTLNAGQYRLGVRTTGRLLMGLWVLAFLYFTHQLLSLLR